VSLNTMVGVASVVYAGGLLLLGLADRVWVAAFALAPLGLAWITVMSSMSAGTQALLPAWARARGLAFYQLVFMGGQAIGAAVWGVLAQHTSLGTVFTIAAGGMLAGTLAGRSRPVHAPEVDLSPAHGWRDPHLEIDTPLDAGPVLVTVEYQVPEDRADAFQAAMGPVGRSRRRTGAYRWALHRDAEDPRRFLETWEVATWGEHLRQHSERVTMRDREWETRARRFAADGTEPRVSHLIAAPVTRHQRPPRT
jgi:quinol monooxygenase YgiN